MEDGQEGVDGAVGLVDGGQMLLDDVRGRHRPGAALFGQLKRRRHRASPRIFGTWKRRSSTLGAWASTTSRSRHGRGSSERRTFLSGRGWAVGSTPVVSMAATWAA